MDVVQKAFLLTCINRGSIELEEAKEILADMCANADATVPSNRQELLQFIENISKSIEKFAQKLELIKHPVVEKEFVVFAYTKELKVTKHQALLTADEIQLFYLVLEKLLDKEDFCASFDEFTSIMNETVCHMTMELEPAPEGTQYKKSKLTTERVSELLLILRNIGYLIESDGKIYMGPRVIAEFKNYLHSRYPDTIKICNLCKDPMFWNIQCTHCAVAFHRDCIRTYKAAHAANCPSCKKPWDTPADAGGKRSKRVEA